MGCWGKFKSRRQHAGEQSEEGTAVGGQVTRKPSEGKQPGKGTANVTKLGGEVERCISDGQGGHYVQCRVKWSDRPRLIKNLYHVSPDICYHADDRVPVKLQWLTTQSKLYWNSTLKNKRLTNVILKTEEDLTPQERAEFQRIGRQSRTQSPNRNRR